MTNFRLYGKPPYKIAVIHGGPGAPGEMAPVARELALNFGVVEPLQTETTIKDQVEELKGVIEDNCSLPITIIGYSWGAFLSWILTAQHPDLISKLILVDSGPFEAIYAEKIMPTRLTRLAEEEQTEVQSIIDSFNNGNSDDKMFTRFGELMGKADHYEVNHSKDETMVVDSSLFQKVWNEAEAMRKSGELLDLADGIKCPVVAIHGDFDSHPPDGVKIPLTGKLGNFKFYLLEKCGHTPWIEKYAKKKFYDILRKELAGL